MSKSTVSASFKCKECLSPIIFPDNVTDNTVIKCGECGTDIGPYRDFKAIARNATRKLAVGMARKAFKRRH